MKTLLSISVLLGALALFGQDWTHFGIGMAGYLYGALVVWLRARAMIIPVQKGLEGIVVDEMRMREEINYLRVENGVLEDLAMTLQKENLKLTGEDLEFQSNDTI